MLHDMKERGTPPDAVCCQTVLRVLDRWDRAEEAFGLFEEMQGRRFALAPGAYEVRGVSLREETWKELCEADLEVHD